jgi:hypothetical protein
VRFAGKPFPTEDPSRELGRRIRSAKRGEPVKIGIVRDGKRMTVTATWPEQK